ncbi:MAG: hypothetical protein HY400_07730 [Elusimicrobia bacterium]|nr:hypothetical protein [Elusimicrobiota bacterium]
MAKRKLQDSFKKLNLVTLLQAHPAVLEVLDKHGIHFCAGCYLTLSSPLDRAAAYHAVPDVARFLKDIEKFAKEN